MRGLILKDLINLKAQGKILGLFIIIYVAMGAMMNDASFFVGFITVILMILPITALSYDERAKWDRYALTMPVSRTTMVLEKYILALGLFVIAVIIDIIASAFMKDESTDLIVYVTFMSLVAVIMVAVVLPIIYKIGVEKARYVMIAIVCMPIVLISVVSQIATKGGTMPAFLMKLSQVDVASPFYLALAAVLSIVILAVSFVLSLKIYLNKEF